MPSQEPAPRLAQRGVWWTPFTVNGARALIAVTHTGERVAERVVRAGEDERAAAKLLWTILDAADPKTEHAELPAARLQIVRGALEADAAPRRRTRRPRLTVTAGGDCRPRPTMTVHQRRPVGAPGGAA